MLGGIKASLTMAMVVCLGEEDGADVHHQHEGRMKKVVANQTKNYLVKFSLTLSISRCIGIFSHNLFLFTVSYLTNLQHAERLGEEQLNSKLAVTEAAPSRSRLQQCQL